MKTIQSILCALMVAAVAVSATRADDKQMPAAKASTKAGKTVTVDELGDILENLGYNPKPGKNDDGEVFEYNLEFSSGTLNFCPWMTWNKDKTKIYVQQNIMITDGKSPLPMEVLQQLLEENADIFPSSCYLISFPDGRLALRIFTIFPNEGVTPSLIRKTMEQYCDSTKVLAKAFAKGLAIAKAKADAKGSKIAKEPTVP